MLSPMFALKWVCDLNFLAFGMSKGSIAPTGAKLSNDSATSVSGVGGERELLVDVEGESFALGVCEESDANRGQDALAFG